jgi:mRNA interferase MazF
MRRPLPIFERHPVAAFSVVRVPFPFSERLAVKRRPAVVLSAPSFQVRSGHVLLAMVTSAEGSAWPLDWPILDLKQAGLKKPCLIRMKLFTLDERLLLEPLGQLAQADQEGVARRLAELLAMPRPTGA